MEREIEFRKFLDDVAQAADGDFATSFKMLGFVIFVSRYGAEDLLSGSMVSPRTYYRWIEIVKAAGWQDLLADVRLTQALREYATDITAQPAEVRNTVLHRLTEVLNSGS